MSGERTLAQPSVLSLAPAVTLLVVAQLHDSPERYLRLMRQALPLYDRLQEEVTVACTDLAVSRMLDLGAGTGETSRRYLESHPSVRLVAVDASETMLEIVTAVLGSSVELRHQRLDDPLPGGPFDLVVSALAVHHLDREGKADLFARIAEQLARGGRFVMGDVVVSDRLVAQPAPLDPGVDFPDSVDDLLDSLRQAGLEPSLRWADGDLAVIAADLAG
jgi:tRNA (cmo5U34)-methyltransferase